MKEERPGFIPTPLPLMREVKAVYRPRKYVERLTRRYRQRFVVKEIRAREIPRSIFLKILKKALSQAPSQVKAERNPIV